VGKLQLHDLTAEELSLQSHIEDLDDSVERTVCWEEELRFFHKAWEQKAISLAKIYRNLESQKRICEEEAKRISGKAAVIERSCESLRMYLETEMKRLKIERIPADTFDIKFRKLPDLLLIEPIAQIPEKYLHIVPESREPDKVALLKAVKAGENIEGIGIAWGRTKLEIK
jgi:hypothetical protein